MASSRQVAVPFFAVRRPNGSAVGAAPAIRRQTIVHIGRVS